MDGFVWLEINRFIFDLDEYIGVEFFVEWNEFIVGLFGLIIRFFVVVDKSMLYYNIFVGSNGIGKYICIFCMVVFVILWVGLIFRVSFNQEVIKIGNEFVNFLGFVVLLFLYGRIEWISSI